MPACPTGVLARLSVFSDAIPLDYDTFATHVHWVAKYYFDDCISLVIDRTNGPLAEFLYQLAVEDAIPYEAVQGFHQAAERAQGMVLFTSVHRKDLLHRLQPYRHTGVALITVTVEDTLHGW
jgi:hypothetical protein